MVNVHGMASAAPWLVGMGQRLHGIIRTSSASDLGSTLRASLGHARNGSGLSYSSDDTTGSGGGTLSGLAASLRSVCASRAVMVTG